MPSALPRQAGVPQPALALPAPPAVPGDRDRQGAGAGAAGGTALCRGEQAARLGGQAGCAARDSVTNS